MILTFNETPDELLEVEIKNGTVTFREYETVNPEDSPLHYATFSVSASILREVALALGRAPALVEAK